MLCGKITFPFLINFLGFIDCWNSYWLSFNKSTTNISHDSMAPWYIFHITERQEMTPEFHCSLLEFIVPPLLLSLSDSELWWAAALTSLCHVHSQALRKSDVCVLQGFYMSSDFSSTHTFFWQFSAAERSRLESLPLCFSASTWLWEVMFVPTLVTHPASA